MPLPTPTPATEPCRISYPTAIVPGPAAPDPPRDDDRVFRSLTIHPSNPDIVLLGTERNGFIHSRDGGATWVRYRAGLRGDNSGYSEVWDVDFSASDPDIIMAAILAPPGLPAGPNVGGGIYRSTDGGRTWTLVNCGFTTAQVVSVRIDPSNPDVAVTGLKGGSTSFYNTGADQYFQGGIFRTEDGGQNWSRVPLGPNDGHNGYTNMRITTGSPPQIVTFGDNADDPSENLGFLRSNDMGRTWESFAPDFRTRSIDDFGLSADGRTIYANEGGTYFGWVSKDAGETWGQSPIYQVNGPIAVSPADPELVIFGSSEDLRRSTDGLTSIKVVMSDVGTVREIVFSSSNPNVVYAETNGYVLYRSDDAGLTWRLLVNGREEVLNVQP